MVDTGLMRKNEFNSTYKIFKKKKYNLNIRIVKASKIYFKKLKKIFQIQKKEKKLLVIYSSKFFEKEVKKK